jgi:hypothetical protein
MRPEPSRPASSEPVLHELDLLRLRDRDPLGEAEDLRLNVERSATRSVMCTACAWWLIIPCMKATLGSVVRGMRMAGLRLGVLVRYGGRGGRRVRARPSAARPRTPPPGERRISRIASSDRHRSLRRAARAPGGNPESTPPPGRHKRRTNGRPGVHRHAQPGSAGLSSDVRYTIAPRFHCLTCAIRSLRPFHLFSPSKSRSIAKSEVRLPPQRYDLNSPVPATAAAIHPPWRNGKRGEE